MNPKKLKALSEKNETAGRVLSMIADRQRNTMFTAFSGLRADLKKRDGKEVDRKDFDATFKELEKIGAGTLKCSEKGTCYGFTWEVPIRDVGAAIKGGSLVEGKTPIVPTVPYQSSDASVKRPATVVILRKGKGAETFETDEAHAVQVIKDLSI